MPTVSPPLLTTMTDETFGEPSDGGSGRVTVGKRGKYISREDFHAGKVKSLTRFQFW